MSEEAKYMAQAMQALREFGKHAEDVESTLDKTSNMIMISNPITPVIREITTAIQVATLDETMELMNELMELAQNPLVQSGLDKFTDFMELLLGGFATSLNALDTALDKVHQTSESIKDWLGINDTIDDNNTLWVDDHEDTREYADNRDLARNQSETWVQKALRFVGDFWK